MMKKNWTNTFIVSGGHFWVDYYCAMLLPLLPIIVLQWGLSNTQLALLLTVQSLTANFIQPFLGHIMDKNPARWSLNFGMLLSALPICLLFLAPNYPVFILMVALGGLGFSIYHPLGVSRMLQGPAQEMAIKMSVYTGVGSLGFSLAPAITSYIISKLGIQVIAFLLVPGFLMMPLLSRVRYDASKTGAKTEGKTEENKAERINIKSDLEPMLMISALVGLRAWLVMAITVFIPLWLVSCGISEKAAGLLLTLYLLVGTLGGFLQSFLHRWLSTRKILTLAFLTSGALLPLYFYSSGNIVIFLLLGLMLQGTLPITIVLGQEMLPDRAGLSSGLTMGLSFGIGALGNLLTGVLADHWGITAAVLLTSLTIIPAVFLTTVIHKHNSDSHREERPLYEQQ